LRGADGGAVFVESMIAAAIVALVLGTTFEVIADGARREKAAANHRLALLVAQSALDDVGADIRLDSGETSGASGPFVWRVDVTPYVAEGEPDTAGSLWKADVMVRRREGGPSLASLSTLRLGG
jgi:hypothetical protein